MIGGDGIPCPTGGYGNEIDIAELTCESLPTMMHVIHRYYPSVDCNVSNRVEKDKKEYGVMTDVYSIYKCVWTPYKIQYFINDNLMHEVINNNNEWYPSFPLNLILSQQVTKTYNILGQEIEPITPQTSYFDYVKVKQFFLAPEITCPSIICSTGSATMNVDPLATNITWQLTPSALFTTTSGIGNIANIVRSSGANGAGKITFTFQMPSGEYFTKEKTVWVGSPTLNVTGPDYQCPGDDGLQYYASGDGATSYLWEIEDGAIQIIGANNQQMCALYFYPNYLNGELHVTASNECGTVDQYYMMYWDPRCNNNWYYSFSPNPANTTLTVERLTAPETVNRKVLKPAQIIKASTKVQRNDNSYTIEIWHEKKGKVKTLESVEKKLEIDVSTLEKGNYFLHIITPTAIYKEQLLIQ